MEESDGKTKSSAGMKKIEEQILEHARVSAKKRWLEIDLHWKKQETEKKAALEKAKTLLTEEELFLLGIITKVSV